MTSIVVAGVLAIASLPWWGGPTNVSPVVAVLVLCTVVAELFPIKAPYKGALEEVNGSFAFAFAVLLLGGAVPAMVALVAGAVIADLRAAKPPVKLAFNAAQYAICLAAATLVLRAADLPSAPDPGFAPADIPLLVLAGAVTVAVNIGIVGVVGGLANHRAILGMLREAFVIQVPVAVLMLGLAPVVAVVGGFSLALVPALLLPVAAVHVAGMRAEVERRQAQLDRLTGLLGRHAFDERVTYFQAVCDSGGAVVVLDLDHFGEINDTLGHPAGDRVLIELAGRLADALEDDDLAARLGGDELAVVLPNAGDPEVALAHVERLQELLAEPMQVDGVQLDLAVTAGIARWPEHGEDATTLLRRADAALSTARARHRRFAEYHGDEDERSVERLALLGQLRGAIDAGHLAVVGMPLVDVATGRVVAVEALVRWEHPTRGTLGPGLFVPYAEATGLIHPLTTFVLERSLELCAAWHASGNDVAVAVNLSARSLADERLASHVADRLAAHGLPPHALELEITESTIMADADRAHASLAELAGLGVRLAIDDFGTGATSMGQLGSLPVDTLKIDRSYVSDLLADDAHRVMVRAMIGLGHDLGLEVVAEGVEDAGTLEALRAMGCDRTQGWLHGKPVALEPAAPPAPAPVGS